MDIQMFEAVVEHGQIKLQSQVQLPDNLKVYVIVPESRSERTVHIHSPKLKDSTKIADFALEVTED